MDRVVTDIIHPIACGLDVHSALVAACLIRSGPQGGPCYEERSFATTLRGLRELRDWLQARGCQTVGLEATGVYWIPVYAVLEGHVSMVVGNPNHMRNLRGHKTDRKDAKWIAGLTRHGLIRPSFVPKVAFREARELTRCRRQLVNARTAIRNEITRLLSHQGIPLGSEGLLSNLFGVSGMAILEALAEGRNVLEELPKLLARNVRHKRELLSAALEAGLGEIARKLLALHLARLESVEADIHQVEDLIAAQLSPHQAQMDMLMTIPGISRISASVLLAELGVDMSQWPTHRHLSAWGGVAPGCRESGGKAHRAATRKGNPYVCTTLVECAGAAVMKKDGHLAATYRRLCARTGSKMKAKVAVARKLLVIVYHVLSTMKPYAEPEPRTLHSQAKQKAIQRHLRDLRKLGLDVQIAPNPSNI
ncbi:MAG TPA: IS110 family transposase [Fibrobacteria bacterium]|nr:IS110 family transposase [Fibrobacteria bacterium]